MTKISYPCLMIAGLVLLQAAPAAAQDASPSLEETRRFIQSRMSQDSVFATVEGNQGAFTLRTAYVFGFEISPPPGANACTISFAENHYTAATRKEAVAMNFPQQSKVVDIFLGGKMLRISTSESAGMGIVTIAPPNGKDFVSTRIYRARYENSGNTGGYVRQREGARTNDALQIGVTTQDDVARLKSAFEHMANLCADAKAPEGFGKSLF